MLRILLIALFLCCSALTLSGALRTQTASDATNQSSAQQPDPFAGLAAGQCAVDCFDCPEIVVVPGGTFLMGSPSTEKERIPNEWLPRSVKISTFGAGKYSVTVREWKAFVAATHRYDPAKDCYSSLGSSRVDWQNPGFVQDDQHPVICVSWYDAEDYIDWLSGRTHKTYRLLSESEWEYAARANTTTPYWTGETITPSQTRFRSNDGTVRVGSFQPNGFGLYDMVGNVAQWVEDCYVFENEILAPPSDGRPNRFWGCDHRVARGADWAIFDEDALRSASREGPVPNQRFDVLGFRVARDL